METQPSILVLDRCLSLALIEHGGAGMMLAASSWGVRGNGSGIVVSGLAISEESIKGRTDSKPAVNEGNLFPRNCLIASKLTICGSASISIDYCQTRSQLSKQSS